MYTVLGAAPGASEAELKAAYEARLAELDREEHTDPGPVAQASIRAARSRLEEAWEILSDPKQRLHHDQPAPAVGDPDAPPPLHHLPPPPPPGIAYDPTDTRRPPTGTECQLCGSAPAARLTLRRETGLVVVRQSRVIEGTYCRDCGLSLFRETTDKTLMTGWWGFISFFVNWFTVARNVAGRLALRDLTAPVPNAEVRAPLPAPLDPGKPLFRRFGPYVVLGLVVVIAGLVLFVGDPPPTIEDGEAVGSCLDLSDDLQRIDDVVPCDGNEDATITSVVDLDQACPSTTIRFQDDQGAFCLTLS